MELQVSNVSFQVNLFVLYLSSDYYRLQLANFSGSDSGDHPSHLHNT